MKLQDQQKAERRERILEAARRGIGERGYEALTMRDLAQASRVTVPTVYNLVGGKEDVLFAAVEEQTARFVSSIDDVEARAPAAHLLAVVDATSRELLRLPGYYRSLLQLLFASDSASPVRDEVGRALAGQLGLALGELRTSGELCAWVDVQALLEQITVQLTQTSLRWATGELTRDQLRAASLHGVCLLLLGVTRGASRDVFERTVREVQGRSARRPRAGARRAAGSEAGGGA